MTKIYSSIYCRKTDENNLFVELDNNKQVEYRVKSPKFLYYVFQYYYLNIKILKFYENWNFLKILKSCENW
jgi:hypothetical protein